MYLRKEGYKRREKISSEGREEWGEDNPWGRSVGRKERLKMKWMNERVK